MRGRRAGAVWLICAGLALLSGAAAEAQTLDCQNPTTQIEMTGCAAKAYEAADGDLNLAYKIAVDRAKQMDTYLPEGDVPARIILRDAQRAWLPFRDKACEAESLLARGGSMQNQIFYICLERLTRQRTEDLRLFGEVY